MADKAYLMEMLAEYGITNAAELDAAIASRKRPDIGVMTSATKTKCHKELKKCLS